MAGASHFDRPGGVRSRDVDVDPRCRLPYYTYVLRGMEDAGCRIRFRALDCPPSNGMAMTIDGARVWVHTDDNPHDLPEGTLAWADIAAKVNVLPEVPSILALGPLFGIRIWPLPGGYARVISLVRGGGDALLSLRHVRFQGITRIDIDGYHPGVSDPGYLFARSRDWRGRHAAVTEPRQRFAAAVEVLPLRTDLKVSDDRVNLPTYLGHVQRSAVVFNNPAVHGCLGWKLGEFLALGKAIVSLRFPNALPAPLEHGRHVHFVADDVTEMRDAVRLITTDAEYRRHLEQGARSWFDDHMTPARVGRRILDAVDQFRTAPS